LKSAFELKVNCMFIYFLISPSNGFDNKSFISLINAEISGINSMMPSGTNIIP